MSRTDTGIEAGLSPSRVAPLLTYRKEATTMVTTTTDRAEVFSRPAARFDDDGNLEVRASSALGCRRALWYAATGYEPTNPPSDDSLTAMEAGNALEPVVVRAMERAGWKVDAPDPQDPKQVAVRVGPNMIVTGHPDGTVRLPIEPETNRLRRSSFSSRERRRVPAVYGDPMVVEIKTRGPEAFKRWQTLGAERSHPASVAQAAFYSLGEFGDLRDAVIATMDTGARTWDWERIPAARLERALQDACEWLGELAAHHVRSGPDPDALPESGLLRNQLAVPKLPVPGGLPAGSGGSERRDGDRDRGGERRRGTGRGGGLRRGSGVHQGAREGQARRAGHSEGVDAPPG